MFGHASLWDSLMLGPGTRVLMLVLVQAGADVRLQAAGRAELVAGGALTARAGGDVTLRSSSRVELTAETLARAFSFFCVCSDSPHVITLIELRTGPLISHQDYHMMLLTLAGHPHHK